LWNGWANSLKKEENELKKTEIKEGTLYFGKNLDNMEPLGPISQITFVEDTKPRKLACVGMKNIYIPCRKPHCCSDCGKYKNGCSGCKRDVPEKD
jgi:hypothetical protein